MTVETFFDGGVPAAKFEDKAYGTVIGGEITSDPRMVQQKDYTTGDPITYSDGNPAMQMVVTVRAYAPNGDDDGERSFFIKGQMKQAIGEALRKVGAKTPARGGRLWIKYVEDKPVTLKNGRPGNPQKIYVAKYEPPAGVAAGAYFDDEPPVPAAAPSSAPPRAYASPAAAPSWPDCPPGVDPGVWASMSGSQREQMYTALGLPVPQAATLSGGNAFTDEPPF